VAVGVGASGRNEGSSNPKDEGSWSGGVGEYAGGEGEEYAGGAVNGMEIGSGFKASSESSKMTAKSSADRRVVASG